MHFGEWLQSVLELVVNLDNGHGRKPLAVVGGKAGKADDIVLELKDGVLVDEDEESGLEMEEKLGSLLVSIILWLRSFSFLNFRFRDF